MIKGYVPVSIMTDALGAELVEAELKAQAALSSGAVEPESKLLSMYESVGIIEIKGKLTNKDSRYNSWYGLVSYNEIREAANEAVELGAAGLLFDIDSPGGAVAGMEDLSNYIRGLEVTTVAHTSSTMASAAYFFGASCDKCFSGKMSEVGSVGVVMQHVDMTKALDEWGYKVTVIRSGDKKAVGGPYEKLSPANLKYLQGQVATYAGMFFDFVSDVRGIPLPSLGAIKDGGTFIGAEAVEAGLVDKLMSFDEALFFTMEAAQKSLDNSQGSVNNVDYHRDSHIFGSSTQGEIAMPKSISKAALEALAAKAGTETPAVDAAEDGNQEGVIVEAAAEAVEGEETLAPEAEVVVVEDEPTAEVVVLQDQVEGLQGELVDAQEAGAALQAELDEANVSLEASEEFKTIIVAQINTMRSALNLVSVDLEAFTPQAVLKDYKATLDTFEKSLVVGGVVPNEEGQAAEATPTVSREDVNSIKNLTF